MLVLAALLAASAAPSATPTGVRPQVRAQVRATVRIVRGATLRGNRMEVDAGEDRPSRGRILLTNPDGSRQSVSLYEFP